MFSNHWFIIAIIFLCRNFHFGKGGIIDATSDFFFIVFINKSVDLVHESKLLLILMVFLFKKELVVHMFMLLRRLVWLFLQVKRLPWYMFYI
jgi:hypothetical protein